MWRRSSSSRAAIVERLLDDVIAGVERSMPWRPGAIELLSALRDDGVPCAMVTMSYARLAETLVRHCRRGTSPPSSRATR